MQLNVDTVLFTNEARTPGGAEDLRTLQQAAPCQIDAYKQAPFRQTLRARLHLVIGNRKSLSSSWIIA